jgi:hypothetical protein
MHLPLIIAILAFLALFLLTAVDPAKGWDIHAKGTRAYGSASGFDTGGG